MKGKETTKNSTKKRLSFSFFKKHRALAVSLVIIAVAVGSFLVVNYGRYVKDIIQVYYLRTKNFYFSSDKLTIHGKTYEINPWSGTVDYHIDINMSSLLNSLKGTNDDILYDVTCTSDARTECYFGSPTVSTLQDRVLSHTTHADNFVATVKIKSGVQVHDGDIVSVTITANAKDPYEEELKATFKLVIGNYGVNYKIEDVSGRLYMDALVSNTLPTDTIRVKLDITNTNKYSFDMTNNVLNAPGTVTTEDSNHNIVSVTFNVDPKSSMMIRYFKNDPAENNTYDSTGIPVITFTRIS